MITFFFITLAKPIGASILLVKVSQCSFVDAYIEAIITRNVITVTVPLYLSHEPRSPSGVIFHH